MAKISPVSSKYIVHSTIQIDGVVDRPDVIGAIFGQTEGLLGADLELRELQRSGRIGRIEVKIDVKSGKSEGAIIIPSSLDKAETAIIAAAMETIQRIGPCNAKVKIDKLEDVRISKRHFVIERAKVLLKQLTENVLPDSQELTEEVSQSVRMMEIIEYGKDRLPAGPGIEEFEEVIIVEGRADVLNLLKNGFKNVISMNGTSVPQTIVDLCKRKTVTAFVDGDRGGDLILKELSAIAELDFVVKAPDGKEVEELTKKEIHKALRSKVAIEQVKLENTQTENGAIARPQYNTQQRIERPRFQPRFERTERPMVQRPQYKRAISEPNKSNFKKMLDDLMGTRGAYLLDSELKILGKVPVSELAVTLKGVNAYAVVFDGSINSEIVSVSEKANVKYLVAMSSAVRPSDTRIDIVTNTDLS